MATVLPGSPPAFNKNDVSGTVKALCNYTRVLQENLDFLLGQMKKEIISIQEDITSINGKLSAVQTAINGLQSNLEGLSASVTAQSNQLKTLSDRVSALESAGQ